VTFTEEYRPKSSFPSRSEKRLEENAFYLVKCILSAEVHIDVVTWDAENRPISMTSLTNAPAASRKKIEFEYDWQSRRIQKKVSTWNGSSYVLASTHKCVYDGWNKIAELNGTNAVIQTYVWGSDLSGSMQGAGGVGGLLAVDAGTNGVHFVAMNGNGDVSALVSAADGSVTGEYEYGPFGETIKATGTMAAANPFRFSTKYQDRESGIINYEYRGYDPIKGRFLSRDPAGEEDGGANLYAFVSNDGINKIDPVGLYEKDFHYDVIYFLLRAKCFSKEDATAIASASQGVDDSSHTQPISPASANPSSPNFPFSPENIGQAFSGGGLNNGLNPEQLAQYHFAGAGPNTATTRNHPTARTRTASQLAQWKNGSGDAQETGIALHLYADTWAHEGFTPWYNKKINKREGRFPYVYIGHADAPEGGHAPDRPYNDVNKALEAARNIYDLIPDRSEGSGVPSFGSLEPELRSKFGTR